jgi:mono/diheme cytochrome c family protein
MLVLKETLDLIWICQKIKDVAYVKDMVQNGLGVMPAFGEDGILTPEEVDIVSKYVANVAGK